MDTNEPTIPSTSPPREPEDEDPAIDPEQPDVAEDIGSPATPERDPRARALPVDHPSMDSNVDETERYMEGDANASEYWEQHESNDHDNDALYGDNGTDS